ncbi:MAG: hypothetical protein KGZ74_01890 [Chitinophagaceae bacterium]|nr:hypothetical protein [Chitinophagaceae bacterium]
MKQLLKKLIKYKSIRYKLVAESSVEVEEIKLQLAKLDCKVENINEASLMGGNNKNSVIVLAIAKDSAKNQLEEYYQKAIVRKHPNVKFLVVSDEPIWKKRHDNQTVFNFPSNTHSYEIARNLHYLSLVG